MDMRDGDVRSALRGYLRERHASDSAETRFIDELDLCGQVRVDVAVLNGTLAGYELKSAHDTLQRLPVQVDVYSKVLDMATVVLAERHLQRALPMLPAWWGGAGGRGGRRQHRAPHAPSLVAESGS